MVADMKGSYGILPSTAPSSTRYLLLFGVCITLLRSLATSSPAADTSVVNHIDSPDDRYSSDRATSQFQVDDVFTAGVRRRRNDAELDSELQQQQLAIAARARRAAPGGRWAKTNLQVWGKREADTENARAKDWAKNNFKIWGKRNFDDASADDSERADETTTFTESERNKWQEAMRLLRSLFLIRGEPSRLPAFGTRSRTVDGDVASMYYNTKRETKEEDLSGVPDWGKKGWASNNVRIWG